MVKFEKYVVDPKTGNGTIKEVKVARDAKTTVRKPKGYRSDDSKYDGGGHNTANLPKA